jgi:trypsin
MHSLLTSFRFTRLATLFSAALLLLTGFLTYSSPAKAVINGEVSYSLDSYIVGLHNTHLFNAARDEGKDPYWATQFCAGVLVSSHKVVTAAHCLAESTLELGYTTLGVGFGGLELKEASDYKIFPVKSYTIHPQYSTETNFNDIAVIELETPIPLAKYAALPSKSDKRLYKEKRWLEIIGWGEATQFWKLPSETLDFPVHARSGFIQVTPKSLCGVTKRKAKPSTFNDLTILPLTVRNKDKKLFRDSTFCAIGYSASENDFIDTCKGDSGGPVIDVATRKIIGLVSWGISCASVYPGAYTKIITYLDFIEKS